MHCIICEINLPIDNYAIVEGIYFCLSCFLLQHSHINQTQISSTSQTTLS